MFRVNKILLIIFFCVGYFLSTQLYADNTSGMPDWSAPIVSGEFDSSGAGKIFYSFSDSGGTKTGPGGTTTYSFNIPKGNIISITINADDSATLSIPAANISASSHWDASQKKIIPGEGESTFINTDEISEETIPVTINYTNAGGPYLLSFTVSVERVRAELKKVNVIAPSKLILSQDDGSPFDGEDWVKNRSRNNELRESNPISITSGDALTFVPTFEIVKETTLIKVKAEFSIPSSMTTSQIKDYSNIASGFEISAPVDSGRVNYFDNSLTATWFVQYDGCDKWFSAGTSSHEIYFTRTTPQTNFRQETLFWVACSGNVCGKTTDTEITDAIWSKFSTGTEPTNLARKDGAPLKYWGADEETPIVDVSGLMSNLDGRCGAWVSFFYNALKVHGIFAVQTTLYPNERERDGILIDNYEFSNIITQELPDGFTHFVDHMIEGIVPDGYVKNRSGIVGQNNFDPYSLFKNHQLIFANNRFLDPSYGKTIDVLKNENCPIAGAVRDELFLGKNIAKSTRSFSYEIGGTPNNHLEKDSKIKQETNLESWEKGNISLLWEQRNIWAENRFFLYRTDNEKCDEQISLELKKRNNSQINIPQYLKRVHFPLDSSDWFRGISKNVQFVKTTENGIVISMQVYGYRLMWEYNPEKDQWKEYPSGNIFIMPKGGIVSATLWFLGVLKRNGLLDGNSPKDYPIPCLFSSNEIKNGKNIDEKEMEKFLRNRERILKDAILVEFSEDLIKD